MDYSRGLIRYRLVFGLDLVKKIGLFTVYQNKISIIFRLLNFLKQKFSLETSTIYCLQSKSIGFF